MSAFAADFFILHIVFFAPDFVGGFFFIQPRNTEMHLRLVKNPDESKIIQYKIARVIYAETNASSLQVVEALASMIANYCVASQRQLADIIEDKSIFESLNTDSVRHGALLVDCRRRDFDMCLRVVQRMLNGDLGDVCSGATKFHRNDSMPEWATSRGYITEVDDLTFYL